MRVGFRRKGIIPFFPSSTLNLRFTAGVGVGISGACEPPLVWRARKPLPWALRSSAALALGLALPRAPAPELSSGTESLTAPPKDASFSSLFCFFSISLLSAFACCSVVTVTSVSFPPFVSRRGLFNTNQRLSLSLGVVQADRDRKVF